jgi:hypothetical protein
VSVLNTTFRMIHGRAAGPIARRVGKDTST